MKPNLLDRSIGRAGLELRLAPLSVWYDRRHGRQARAARAIVEAQRGPLDRGIVAQCDDYARHFLGSCVYAPWLHLYAAVNGKFQEGWIPDNYYGRHVVTKRKGAYGELSNLKALTGPLFDAPEFPDIGYLVNGSYCDVMRRAVAPDEIAAALFKESARVVFKRENTRRGQGIHFLDRASFSIQNLRRLGNGVFQRVVRQHGFFDDFSPRAVATLRVTSVVDARGVSSVRSCFLRLGRASDSHVMSASSIRVAVDPKTGQMGPWGALPDWSQIESHPDTGARFAGTTVPGVSDCVRLATQLHARIPFVQCIGWDMTITDEDRIAIFEWNGGHNDIKFSEATQGPCFADLGWDLLWKDDGQGLPG